MLNQQNREITLIAVGDVMLGGNVGKVMLKEGWNYPFEHVASVFKEADIIFGNLAAPLTNRQETNPNKPKGYPVQKTDPRAIQGLKYAGFNVLSLANNHILDYGNDGLFDTIRLLGEASINYLGAGRNQAEARKPLVLDYNNLKVAFLAYCSSYPAAKTNPGNAPIRLPLIKRDLKAAREIADIAIVYLHHGLICSDYPVPSHISLCHEIIDSGANLILGDHPHVLQGIENYNEGVIVYSLGNFVIDLIDEGLRRELFESCSLSDIDEFDFNPDDERTRECMIFKCALSKEGVTEIDIIPVRINDNYQPAILQGIEKESLLARIDKLSSQIKDKSLPIWDVLEKVHAKENVTSFFKGNPWYLLKKLYKIRLGHLRLFISYLSYKFSKNSN